MLFLKSMNAQFMGSLFFCLVSIILVRDDRWSTVLLPLRNSFCSSLILKLFSAQMVSLLFSMLQYNLHTEGANVIPLYESRSLGSLVLDLGMGLIIPLPQSVGILPALKH